MTHQFARLLGALGIAPDERISVCHKFPADDRPTATLGTAHDAPARAERYIGRADVWFGLCPIRADVTLSPGQRGTAAQIARIPALWCDLDAKPAPAGMGSTAGCIGVAAEISKTLRAGPAAMVASGTGGLHVYWRLARYPEVEHPRAVGLLRRFGILVQVVARAAGGGADNVFDPARILRVPGTTNLKPGGGPVTATFPADNGAEPDELTLDDLEDALNVAGIPAAPVAEETDPVAERDWPAGAATCGYVQAMVSGWATDVPRTGRHQWLLAQATRLAAAARLGCITPNDRRAAETTLAARFATICATVGEPRQVPATEVPAALLFGVATIESKPLDAVHAELGNHHSNDQPADDHPTRTVEDQLFGATKTLSLIRQAAHARLVTPWAVLGAVLARVVAEVPPHIVLPPIVGSDGSLNLAVGLVADSGGGKSGADGCADDLLRIRDRRAQNIGPGSGEGVMMAFLEWDKDQKTNRLKQDPLALLTADEIGQIGAVQGRSAQATFGPTMRSMLTGGKASTSAVEEQRRRYLAANSYRLCTIAGIQPQLSSILLDDTDAGTPQRWLWLPADDPHWDAPETDWPGAIEWQLPTWPRGDRYDGMVRLQVPGHVADEIRATRCRRLRGEGDPLDGHRLFTQEKVAAALALLHGETAITDQWWDLAATIMNVSDVTRGRCVKALQDRAVAESRARGRLDAARETGARAARNGAAERYARLVYQELARPNGCSKHGHTNDEGHTRVCLTSALRRHRNKGLDVDAIIDAAETLDWITRGDDGRWRLGSSRPAEDMAA